MFRCINDFISSRDHGASDFDFVNWCCWSTTSYSLLVHNLFICVCNVWVLLV